MQGGTAQGIAVGDEHLPLLYRQADAASLWAQRRYLVLIRLNLCLLVLGAGLAALSVLHPDIQKPFRLAAGFALTVTVIVSLVIKVRSYESSWYQTRAIAESVKGLAWRYMTRSEPLGDGARLTDLLRVAGNVRDEYDEVGRLLHARGGPRSEEEGLATMERVRAADRSQRIQAFARYRVEDQREWYAGKVELNERREEQLFWAALLAQLLAVGLVFLLAFEKLPLDPTGVLTASAGAVLAWARVRRHRELSRSYSAAAHALEDLGQDVAGARTDEELARFAGLVEDEISREHTLWLTRRSERAAR
jgi:hypothetical protein